MWTSTPTVVGQGEGIRLPSWLQGRLLIAECGQQGDLLGLDALTRGKDVSLLYSGQLRLPEALALASS